MKKHIVKLSLLLVLSGIITSCQVGTAQDETVQATLQADVFDPCTPYNELDFELEQRTTSTPPHNATITPGFSVEAATSIQTYEPYDYSFCACSVENFILEFDFLPMLSTDLYLVNAEGDPVSFVESYNPSNNNPWLMIDAANISTDIYIVIEDNLDPKPTLIVAGGICMIENIDNPNGYTGPGPYREAEYNERGEVIGASYYIPGRNLSNTTWVPLVNGKGSK